MKWICQLLHLILCRMYENCKWPEPHQISLIQPWSGDTDWACAVHVKWCDGIRSVFSYFSWTAGKNREICTLSGAKRLSWMVPLLFSLKDMKSVIFKRNLKLVLPQNSFRLCLSPCYLFFKHTLALVAFIQKLFDRKWGQREREWHVESPWARTWTQVSCVKEL